MWKWVIRDYFAAFRWEKLKSVGKNIWWSLIYFCVILPPMGQLCDTPKHMTTYFLVMLPVFLCITSSAVHSIRLPKVMHLCPIEERVKREYVEKSTVFRILFTSVVGITGVVLLVLFDLCDGMMAFVLIADLVLLAVLLSGFCNLGESAIFGGNTEKKYPDMPHSARVIETTNVCVTFISVFMAVYALCWDTPVAVWVKWIFIGFLVLVQIPLGVKLLTYWKLAVDRAVSYESSYL